jgi:hypothetical protein
MNDPNPNVVLYAILKLILTCSLSTWAVCLGGKGSRDGSAIVGITFSSISAVLLILLVTAAGKKIQMEQTNSDMPFSCMSMFCAVLLCTLVAVIIMSYKGGNTTLDNPSKDDNTTNDHQNEAIDGATIETDETEPTASDDSLTANDVPTIPNTAPAPEIGSASDISASGQHSPPPPPPPPSPPPYSLIGGMGLRKDQETYT